MKDSILETLKQYKSALEQDGYKVLYIGLYGSNNYSLDDELSDIDAKAIVMPTLDDIIFKRTISNVKEFETGAVDYKDLITFYNVVKKGNFSFTEPFHSEYYIGDAYFRDLFQQIPTNLLGVMGGMMEKRKALTHEYPSKQKEFEAFGCDPKQFHHILRLYELFIELTLKGTSENTPYLDYKERENKEYLTKLKREMLDWTVEKMEQDADEKVKWVKEELKKRNYKYSEQNFEKEVASYLKNKLTEMLERR